MQQSRDTACFTSAYAASEMVGLSDRDTSVIATPCDDLHCREKMLQPLHAAIAADRFAADWGQIGVRHRFAAKWIQAGVATAMLHSAGYDAAANGDVDEYPNGDPVYI